MPLKRTRESHPDALLGESAIVVESLAKCYHGLAERLMQAPTPLLTRAFRGARPEGIDDLEGEGDEDDDEVVEPDQEEQAAEIPGFVTYAPLAWVLEDISFRAAPGEAIALIGAHGSGKTTLLKVLAGVLLPSRGSAVLRSRPSPLIVNAVQFIMPTYSPSRNAAFVAAFAGVPRRRLRRALPAIYEFAGLTAREQRGPATTKPLELTLGVILHMETDVLLLDDPFAVVGAEGRERCIARIQERIDEGAAVILETGDRDAIRRICTRALWLDGGRIVRDGPVEEIFAAYDDVVARSHAAGPTAAEPGSLQGFNATAAIAGITCVTKQDAIRVEIGVEAARPGIALQIGAGLASNDGRGLWFEQPEPVISTDAGVHRFELVARDVPVGSYAGRVEVRLPTDVGEETIGRDDAFRVEVGVATTDTPVAPASVTWEPQEGTWRALD